MSIEIKPAKYDAGCTSAIYIGDTILDIPGKTVAEVEANAKLLREALAEHGTRPWFVWDVNVPEESGMVFEASGSVDAIAQYVTATGVTTTGDDAADLSAKPVKVDDLHRLWDEAEERAGNQSRLRTLIEKAQAVLLRQIVPDGISDHDALTELHGIFDSEECRAATGWKYQAPKKRA